MAIQIKDMGAIAEKWLRRAGTAGAEYQEGVTNPLRDWEANAKAAEAAYLAGLQASMAKKTWSKGLSGKKEKWSRNAINKGASRYPGGIALAGGDYEDGFSPYRGVIAGLTLPARGPKGDPANIRRVEMVAKALHDKKVS